jgi:hypothetical protein
MSVSYDGQVHEILVQPATQHHQDHHLVAFAFDHIRGARHRRITRAGEAEA